MSDYDDNAWADYDYYMHTGELAEYFEDTPEEEYKEEIVTEEVVEYKDLNEQLDDVIRCLKQQIKEKERIIEAQKRIERKRIAQAKINGKRTKNVAVETPLSKKQTLSYNTKSTIGCFLFVLNIILWWLVLTM